MRSVTFSIPNDYSHVALVTRCIVTLASHVTAEDSGVFETAIGEALNNVIEHSYGDGASEQISVVLSFDADEVQVIVEDRGEGMTPEAFAQAPAEFAAPEDPALLPEGGFGLTLIKLACDEVDYSRVDGVNRLVMRRYRRGGGDHVGGARRQA